MKPVTLNITNLVGTMTIVGVEENQHSQIEERVAEALMRTIKTATKPDIVVAPSEKDYVKAKRILRDLIETACRAIIAIEDKKPNHEICDLAIEEIENLLGEISSCILGD